MAAIGQRLKALNSTAEKGLAAGFKAYGYGRDAAEQVEALLLMTSILRAQLGERKAAVAMTSKDLKSSIRKGELLDKDEVAKSGSDIESSRRRSEADGTGEADCGWARRKKRYCRLPASRQLSMKCTRTFR